MTRDPRGAGERDVAACGRDARRSRLYAGSLASLGCYAALARDATVGVPVAADREGVAIRSSTPR
jgi:hypothetical protein